MHFTELFIRRPVMTTLVMLAILLFGAMSYRHLPVSDLPNVDVPTIMVTANLPGASPETMASAVATPLERQFTTIAGLDSMSSSSALGMANITLQFALSRNIDGGAQVQVFGEQKYAVRIQLDPKELASRGLGINEVGEAVQKANVNLP